MSAFKGTCKNLYIFDRLCFPSTSIGKAALADRYDGGRNTPSRSVHAVIHTTPLLVCGFDVNLFAVVFFYFVILH